MNCCSHDELLWSQWVAVVTIAVVTMSCCGHDELLWSQWVAVVTMSYYDRSGWVAVTTMCCYENYDECCCDHDKLWSINSVQEASLANKDQSARMDTMDKPTTSYRNWQVFTVCIARSIRRRISTEPTVPLRWKSPNTWSESGPIAEPQPRTNNRIKHERNNNSDIAQGAHPQKNLVRL